MNSYWYTVYSPNGLDWITSLCLWWLAPFRLVAVPPPLKIRFVHFSNVSILDTVLVARLDCSVSCINDSLTLVLLLVLFLLDECHKLYIYTIIHEESVSTLFFFDFQLSKISSHHSVAVSKRAFKSSFSTLSKSSFNIWLFSSSLTNALMMI